MAKYLISETGNNDEFYYKKQEKKKKESGSLSSPTSEYLPCRYTCTHMK